MKIISRADWGARPAKPGVRTISMDLRTEFMIHYSGAAVDQPVRDIQAWCMDHRGFMDIDYNFLIRGTTGELYEGRGWSAVGSHCINHNRSAIGVCIIGDGQLSADAMTAVRWLYDEAVRRAGHTLTVLGHRDAWPTECPGPNIEHWLKNGGVTTTHRTLRLANPYMYGPDIAAVQREVGASPIDGIYGPLTARAVMKWQHSRGLVDDGVVGPLTWAALGL